MKKRGYIVITHNHVLTKPVKVIARPEEPEVPEESVEKDTTTEEAEETNENTEAESAESQVVEKNQR